MDGKPVTQSLPGVKRYIRPETLRQFNIYMVHGNYEAALSLAEDLGIKEWVAKAREALKAAEEQA